MLLWKTGHTIVEYGGLIGAVVGWSDSRLFGYSSRGGEGRGVMHAWDRSIDRSTLHIIEQDISSGIVVAR